MGGVIPRGRVVCPNDHPSRCLGYIMGPRDGDAGTRGHRLMGKDMQASALRRLQHDGMDMKATAFGGSTWAEGQQSRCSGS